MNIVYLIQLKSDALDRYAALLERDDVDVMVLTYDKPVSELVSDAIYYPNSIWAEGRNKLLEEALKRKKDYLYYIFLDGDVEFIQGDYRAFEKQLLQHKPAIGYPVFERSSYGRMIFCMGKKRWMPEMQSQSMGDGQLQAVHRDVVQDGLMVPFYHGSITTWGDDNIARLIQNVFYRDYTVQFNHIVVNNPEHLTDGNDSTTPNTIQKWGKDNLIRKTRADAMWWPHIFPLTLSSVLAPFKLSFVRALLTHPRYTRPTIRRAYCSLLSIYKTLTYRPKENYRINPKIVKSRLKSDSPLWKQYSPKTN